MNLRSRFGMHTTPFTREIRVEHLLALPMLTEALDGLLGATQQRSSAALIGPAGSGKTALLRALAARLPEARYRCNYVKVSDLGKRDLCREIAVILGLPPAGSYPMLVRRIQENLVKVSDTEGLRPVLLIDEAQDLRPDVLNMLAVVTNFEWDSRLVLSVVLCGQPPLATMLRLVDFEGMARRISHYAVIRTLSRDETHDYIAHRCAVAGAANPPFDPGAYDAIFEIGRGNLRATDQLALKALEVADRRQVSVVDSTHVIEARRVLWP